jgi:hypothetical protein
MPKITSGLSHFTNSTAGNNDFDPLYLNQFEVIFTPPAIVGGSGLLLEQVKNVKGLPELTPTGVVTQYYKFAERNYADGGPEKTSAELEIQFEVNLDDSNSMYTYNTLRQWANIHFNPRVGSQSLKKRYVGELSVSIANKEQEIYRQFMFKKVIMMTPFNAMDLDYLQKTEVYRLTAKFKADWWDEKRSGAFDQSDIL